MRPSSQKAAVNCVASSWVQGRVWKIDIREASVDFPDTALRREGVFHAGNI